MCVVYRLSLIINSQKTVSKTKLANHYNINAIKIFIPCRKHARLVLVVEHLPQHVIFCPIEKNLLIWILNTDNCIITICADGLIVLTT